MSDRSHGKRGYVIAAVLAALVASTLVPPLAASEGFTMPLIDPAVSRWIVTGCQARAKDEELTISGADGFLRSVHPYKDFVCEFEFRPLAGADAEAWLVFRGELPEPGVTWTSKYQIDLKRGAGGKLRGISGPEAAGLIKEDMWNQLRLEVIGSRATLTINGQRAWETDAIAAASGYLGIQAKGLADEQLAMRHWRVTELGYVSLFNGTDLTGWEGAGQPAESCWRVADGLLECTGEKGPWLRSKEQYGDFNLRLEYRVREGGNSGVYTRVPADGNHHGPGAGVEIQLLDDHAEQYRMLKPYQYTGSVYAIVPAEPRVARPAGQWNVIEIECSGTSYRITHNGITVVNADAQQFPELAERLGHGYLGLQNHSEEVWFRHVRIRAD